MLPKLQSEARKKAAPTDNVNSTLLIGAAFDLLWHSCHRRVKSRHLVGSPAVAVNLYLRDSCPAMFSIYAPSRLLVNTPKIIILENDNHTLPIPNDPRLPIRLLPIDSKEFRNARFPNCGNVWTHKNRPVLRTLG